MNPGAIERFAAVAHEFAERTGGGLPYSQLTQAELECAFLYLVDGLTYEEMSKRRGSVVKTIEAHIGRFRVKCGLAGRAQYLAWRPFIAAYWRATGLAEARAELAVAS